MYCKDALTNDRRMEIVNMIDNVPYHIFGDHNKCFPELCKRDKMES